MRESGCGRGQECSRQSALDAAVLWMRGRISGLAERRCWQVKVQVRVLAGSETHVNG